MKHVGAVLIPARRRKSERARPYFTRYRKYLIIYEHLQNSSHRTQTVAAKTRRGPLWGAGRIDTIFDKPELVEQGAGFTTANIEPVALDG